MASSSRYSNRFAIFTENANIEISPFGKKNNKEGNSYDENNPFSKKTPENIGEHNNPFKQTKRSKNTEEHHQLDERNPFDSKKKYRNDYMQTPYAPIKQDKTPKIVVPTKEQFPSLSQTTGSRPNIKKTQCIPIIKTDIDNSFAVLAKEWDEKDRVDKFQEKIQQAKNHEEKMKILKEEQRFTSRCYINPHKSEEKRNKKFIKRIVFDKDGTVIGEYEYPFLDINVEQGESYEDIFENEITEQEEEALFMQSQLGENAFSESESDDIEEQHDDIDDDDEYTDQDDYDEDIDQEYYNRKH